MNYESKGTRMRFIILVSLLVILAGFGCRGKIIEPIDSESILTAEDIGVTDVWLKIHVPPLFQNFEITLKRDTVTILRSLLTAQDTLVLDERLLPNHTYTYTLMHDLGTNRKPQTQIAVTTMDTTSHNFTWEIYTLGDGSSSELLDVAIINDTLAYAVGEIYKKDSTGQFEVTPYNAARWNGHKWNLLRIQFRLDYGTSVIYTYTRIRSVYAFSSNDIWFVQNVGGVTRFKDGEWMMLNFKLIDGPGGANKIWGTSPGNLYFVANNGRIVHYNGTRWEKLTSGTTLDIQGIWGSKNPLTVETEILAVATTMYSGNGVRLLKINGNTVTSLHDNGLVQSINSIWFRPPFKYYIVGNGIYRNTKAGDYNSPWSRYPIGQINSYYSFAVRGANVNDVVVAGAFGELLHFNGTTWRNYYNILGMSQGSFYGVAIKGNLIIAVGHIEDRAVIAVGRR